MLVRQASLSDCDAVAELYAGYVRDSLAAFELVAPTPDEWRAKLGDLADLGLPFLIATSGPELQGCAYVAPWRPRPGYRYTVEDSIYVDPGYLGQGHGSRLMGELIPQVRAWGAKQVIAVIADSARPPRARSTSAADSSRWAGCAGSASSRVAGSTPC